MLWSIIPAPISTNLQRYKIALQFLEYVLNDTECECQCWHLNAVRIMQCCLNSLLLVWWCSNVFPKRFLEDKNKNWGTSCRALVPKCWIKFSDGVLDVAAWLLYKAKRNTTVSDDVWLDHKAFYIWYERALTLDQTKALTWCEEWSWREKVYL